MWALILHVGYAVSVQGQFRIMDEVFLKVYNQQGHMLMLRGDQRGKHEQTM